MQTGFNNILVPVDFTANTELAVKKAIEFASGSSATMHLFHVAKLSSTLYIGNYHIFPALTTRQMEFDTMYTNQKFDSIKRFIRQNSVNIDIVVWTGFSNAVQQSILDKAKKVGADLIIIGKKNRHTFFPFLNTVVPSRLAANSGIPVLTVKRGALDNPIKTVVVAIGRQFPDRKVAIVNELRKKFRMNIKLVSIAERNRVHENLPSALVDAYRFFKSSPINDVSCEVLEGSNRAKAILKYARKVNADLLILSPIVETRLGWLNRHISDELPPQSKTQVLSVTAL